MNKTDSKYNTNREYLEGIALSKGIKSIDFKSEDTIVINKDSQTIEELGANKHFWRSLFFECKEDILKLVFLYQEEKKELPLSLGKRLAKNIGFKLKSKTQEGEIKKEQVFPSSIRTNSPGFDTINVMVSKDEWEKLNALAKKSYGFSAPKVYMPEPFCYQVHIPLENISEVGFKSTDFLSKPYEEKQN